jgi:phage replication initiation protein
MTQTDHLPQLDGTAAELCRALSAAEAGSGADAPGDEPRRVTRGESYVEAIAHIDWFACTFLPGNAGVASIIESVFLVPRSEWEQRAGGWQGYETRVDLGGFGLLAYGGEHQRGTAHLELNAHGCARIQDWNAVRIWCEAYGVRITRIDLAHDDFSGEGVTVEKALDWLREGHFTTGGRAPGARLVDDLGSNKGKTLYVGQRQNGKLCRVYEKGKQLGDPSSPWCRVEVEFRGKSREIPHDVLARRGDYLAGAYPCLAHLSERQDKVRTLTKTAEIGYAHMVECLRTQYGPALNVMMAVESGDPFAVLEQAMRPGTPKRLANLPMPRGESRQEATH